MKKHIRGIVFFLITLLLIFVGRTLISQASASGPVKIAAIFAKTGIAAKDNKSAFEGTRLAVKEINSRGGLMGCLLELIEIDNKSTPLGSKLAAEQAVKHEVTAVIGAVWSSHSLTIARVLQKAEIPMISPASTKPEVTLAGNYIFRAIFNDIMQGRVLAQFAFIDIGARTSVVLKNINEEYCLTLAKYFVEFFKQMGGKVLYEGNYRGTAVDFTDVLTEAKKNRPNIIFVPGYQRDSGLILSQARKMGIKSQFLGGDGWGDQMYDYAGEAIDGACYTVQWHPDVPFPESIYLQNIYQRKYGNKNTEVNLPLTYDSVMLFADAVRRAGSFDRKKIRDALSETKGFSGATGNITFDKNGDPVDKQIIILKFEKGATVFVKSIGP